MSYGTRRRWILLAACAGISGCLWNSVHPINRAPRSNPDASHAIVIIGMGLQSQWPYTEFHLTFPEYSIDQSRITGNCVRFNRIDAVRSSTPNTVTYLAFEVPANTYVYLGPIDTTLAPTSIGEAFKAPSGGVVYFGDYVYMGNKTVEFRRDIDSARANTKDLLPRNAVLELAEPTTVAPGARIPLCTP